MAYIASGLAQLALIRRRELSEQDIEVLNAFALAMRPGAPDAAGEAARQLDSLCPPLQQKEDAQGYLWRTWDIMLDIARSPDVEDDVQEGLVSVLGELKQCAKGEVNVWGSQPNKRVWRDLPLLPMCFDSKYSDPTLEGSDFTTESAQIWYKLSVFGARALTARVLGPYVEAMYTVQSALEQELGMLPVAEMAEWRVKTACAWLTRSPKALLRWAQENSDYGNVEDKTNRIAQGPLYNGPALMCFERWRFWLGRLQELAKPESCLSEESRQVALEAAQTMREEEDNMVNM